MKRIWLVVVAALFPLTFTVAFAGQAMPTAPAAPGKTMEGQMEGGMTMKTEEQKMEGTGMTPEEQKGNVGMKKEEKKMEGAGTMKKMEEKKM